MSIECVVGVLIEHDQGAVKPVSFEVLSAARKLADQVSGKVIALYFSNLASLEAEDFIQRGMIQNAMVVSAFYFFTLWQKKSSL